jgi:tetratricopeptide (TPR) repeat protein
MRKTVLAFTFACLLMSCGSSEKPAAESKAATPAPVEHISIPKDSVVIISIPSDQTQSYSIYYPAKAKSPESTPILLCFDPHGNGRIPIDKYRKWADKLGVAIAGSNTSKNGLSPEQGQAIAANMITDINIRLGFDKKNMALCGFSGGSKVAINAINSDPGISDLIYAGAVTPLSPSHALNILGFAGNQDMNYTDLIQFDQSVSPANPGAVLIEFNGKHEWPDAQTFQNAFYWLAFQIWKLKSSEADSSVLKNFKEQIDKKIAQDETQQDWIGAYQDSRIAYSFLNGLIDVSAYKTKLESIVSKSAYQLAVKQKNEALSKEANQKQVLLQAFQNQGPDWWTKVVDGYNASSNPSDKRLLGFISLACYSYTGQMLQHQNLDGAERILAIYEMSDPKNTDQLYFHALLYAQRNNYALAIKYLQKAIDNGFNDAKKIEGETAFTAVRNEPSYSPIAAALKKTSR